MSAVEEDLLRVDDQSDDEVEETEWLDESSENASRDASRKRARPAASETVLRPPLDGPSTSPAPASEAQHRYGDVPEPLSSWARDIRHLLATWRQKNCLDFSVFRSLWVEWNFSAIHFADVPPIEAPFRLQTLYSCFMLYLTKALPLTIHIGAYYGVYMLYQTQQHHPRVPVRVTPYLMDLLQSLCRACVAQKPLPILEVPAIYARLLESDAFVLTAYLPIPELSSNQPTVASDQQAASNRPAAPLHEVHRAIPDLERTPAAYLQLKAQLIADGLDPTGLVVIDRHFTETVALLADKHQRRTVDQQQRRPK